MKMKNGQDFHAWRALTMEEKEAYAGFRYDLDPDIVNYWWLQEVGNLKEAVLATNYLKETRMLWRIAAPRIIKEWRDGMTREIY